MDVETIKPRVYGKSDKYSWNLYAWMNGRRPYKQIFWNNKEKQFMIGWIDKEFKDFYGTALIRVLSLGKDAETYAMSANGMEEAPDFWEKYQQQGRCAIDPDHEMWMLGDDTRWIESGDKRTCQWCGKVQYKHIEERVEKITHWKDEPSEN